MIHVAPCDCELHVRIRELEAELAERPVVEHRGYWKARAEKAEKWAVVADHEVEIQKARVAKLEAALKDPELMQLVVAAQTARETPEQWGERIALKAAREAREREVD